MLSNPTSNLQTRQRQHRRQNSTPTAFESVKVTALPNIRRHVNHRRGISLDQHRQHVQGTTVSTTINQGYQTTPQHILREAQQQRPERPGQQYVYLGNGQVYSKSPIPDPIDHFLDTGSQYSDSSCQYSYSRPVNEFSSANLSTLDNIDFNLFSSDDLTPTAYLDFSPNFNELELDGRDGKPRSSGRRISGGIIDRVTQFEDLSSKSAHRPHTPPHQNDFDCFPPTPALTPYQRTVKHEYTPRRFVEDYDSSMEKTIRPGRNLRVKQSCEKVQGLAMLDSALEILDCQPERLAGSDSAPMPTRGYPATANLSSVPLKGRNFNQVLYSPVSVDLSPALSYRASPEASTAQFFDNSYVKTAALASGRSYPDSSPYGPASPQSPASSSSYRRSESASSVNLEESVTETGITIDDIATFIAGPDPSDGKWLCLYPECGKRFGRKENIKSHVQTHLGDRQFRCPHCKKCFVRQHDLKRHAKIHSGIKPYPCQCGNSFARHDALTRHRQRGMCIGAFEGIVKKTVKRGRPRKNRPDNEERLKKSSRTRSRNKATSSAASSVGSDSASAGSPQSDLEDILGEMLDNGQLASSFDLRDYADSNQYSLPGSPVITNCVSPQAVQVQSPSAYSSYSEHHQYSHASSQIQEHMPLTPLSPPKSVNTYYSPPGLCESTSSPPASNHYYDFEPTTEEEGLAKKDIEMPSLAMHDDDMFMLEAFGAASHDEITQLEKDPTLLLSKFEDSFTISGADDMVMGTDDVFFGSP